LQQTTDFVLTADIDWASEYCIDHFLGIADRFSLKPTLFVTHESAAIRKAERDGRAELAIHPNFLAGSSHGATPDAVIDHVLKLVPNALAVRYHRYFGAPKAEDALAERGLRYDSNVCRHLEPGLLAERLASGLLQFPVFFEDDVHWDHGLSWDFPTHAAAFFSPGLKVLNFHPFFVALNVPGASFYTRQKQHIATLTAPQAALLRHPGAGAETFLVTCLEAILATGHRFRSFGELVDGNPAWHRSSRPRVTCQSPD
jgi:hypothetical protein